MTRKTSPTTERRPPAPTKSDSSADQNKDADWGFNSKKQEKVLEPRLGIILAVSLLLMFGFVLYQKYQSIQKAGPESMADGPTQDGSHDSGPKPGDPKSGDPKHDGQESESSLQLAGGTAAAGSDQRGGIFAPPDRSAPTLAHAEPTPTRAENTFASAASGPSSGGYANVDLFATEPDSGEPSGIEAAGPPAQSEPSPFGEPAHPHIADAPSEHIAEADPFFHEAPASAEYEPSGTLRHDPARAGAPESAPRSEATWDFGGAHELAHDAPADPAGPFAGSGEAHEQAFHAPQHGEPQNGADQHEPHALQSADLAMPLRPSQGPPSQMEPDPFAHDDPFGHDAPHVHGNSPPAEPAPTGDANPFGNIAEAEPPSDGQKTAHSDWAFDDGSHPQTAEAPHALPAPELPPHHGHSEHSFSTAHSDWDLRPVPHHDPIASHGPELGFPSSPDGQQAGTGFPSQAKPQAVVGEREVTVARNDSLWSISQEAYGTARYVPALARYNHGRVPHPNKLRRGVRLRIPPPEVLEANFPDLFHRSGHRDALVSPAGGTSASPSGAAQPGLFSDAAGRPHYRVGKHDTLSRIAQRYLARASRWTEILALNHDRLQSPETLKPGMILRMPADAGRVTVFSGSPSSR